MNILQRSKRAGKRGILLIELMAYLALFVVVTGFATLTFYEFLGNTQRLRRNADDIVRAMDVGERWRSDVRGGASASLSTNADGSAQFRVDAPSGEVIYTIANGEIRRRAGINGANALWVSNVKTSQLIAESRSGVAAWRWELELKSERRNPLLRPLFTFESAVRSASSQ